MSIELSVITSYQEFNELSCKWEGFRQQQSDNVICNSWEWLNTWIGIFSRSKDQLFLHIWQNDQEIIGIIPCYLKSTFAGNELRFIGTGEPLKSEVCSEFQDFLLKSEFAEKILAQFTDSVMADNNISAIIFNNILTSSIAYLWLEAMSRDNWIKNIKSAGRRFLIPVYKEQTIQCSAFKSKNIKRHATKFLSDDSWRVVSVNNLEVLSEFYPQLIKEHNHTWRKRGNVGAFEQADFVAFHCEYSAAMLAKNKLVAFKIETDCEVSALFYGIIDGDTLYYYQSAVNHESKLSSAGVAMHVIALNIAREKNLAFYDLMKGSNNSYKARYTASDISVVNYSLLNKRYRILTGTSSYLQKIAFRVLNIAKKSTTTLKK